MSNGYRGQDMETWNESAEGNYILPEIDSITNPNEGLLQTSERDRPEC